MIRNLNLALGLLILTSITYGADYPKGFEDPALMEKVMGGDIVVERVLDTNQEGKMIARSYFDGVSSDAYLDLATQYEKYPTIFPMVKKGQTLNVNPEKTVFGYKLDILVVYGVFSKMIYPEMKHTLIRAKGTSDESHLKNELMNYKKDVEFATQSIRLIPFEKGILVEDTIHAKAKQSSPYANAAKKKLIEVFIDNTDKLRNALME